MDDLPLYLLRKPITARRDSDIPRGAFCHPGYDDIIVTSLPASWDADQTNVYQLQEDDFNAAFQPLDVSRLSTDIEQALLDDDLNTDLLDVFQDGMEQGVGGVRSEGFDSISKKYASCVAERIAGLLTQPRGEK